MIFPSQPSFASGEVSPSVYSRVDINKYQSSLRTAKNFIIHSQGGASNRCGFKYIASTKYSDSLSVAQEFIFSQTQAYVLEFGHLYVRFYINGELLRSGGSPYEVSTPYEIGDLELLRFESSADIIFITHPDHKQRSLTRYGSTDWVLDTVDYEDGPFMPENVSDSTSLTVSAVSGTGVTLSVSSVVDSTTSALLHFDTDPFVEETGRTVTNTGSVVCSSAQSVFGGNSGLFSGSNYLSLADSPSWALGTGDFTIEFRVRFNSVSSYWYFITQGSLSSDYWTIDYTGTNQIRLIQQNASVANINITASFAPVIDRWYTIALVRSGTTFTFYVDGVSVGSGSDADTFTDFSAPLVIGGASFDSTKGLNGYMDELRISKGTARYSGTYTPATSAFSLTSATSDFTFSPLHIGALFKLRHYIEGQTVSSSFGSSTTSSSIKCFTTWRLITHGTWTGKLRVEKSTDGGTTWTVLRTFSSANDFNADTSGTEDIEANPEPFLIRLNMYSYTSGTCNVDLTTDAFYQNGIIQITSFTSTTSVKGTVLSEIGLTTATTSWAEGSWSDYRGWPAVSRFYQDRLCYSSTYSEPQTNWLTVTGNYYSFFRHSTLLDTDGITVPLPSRQLNAVNGLIAFKKLLAFTSSSVWSIGPLSGSALTPTSFNTDVEEYSGSASVAPVVNGTEAFFSEFGGETIKNLGFQLANDGFIGSETNILAKHFFEGYTIKKLAYQRKPNNIVWCLRSDGVLLSLTYLKEQEVVGWAKHETDGLIKSICVIPGDNSDELWAIIARDNGTFMEKMEGRKQHVLTDQVFLDSYTETVSNTAVISSLNHLANQIVGVIADNVYLGTYTVSAAGTYAISASYTNVFTGLPYNADLETLNIEVPTQNGSVQGSMVKIGNVTFRLINTRGGYVGPNSDTLHEAFDYDALNAANWQNNGEALGATEAFSGDIRHPLGGEYSRGGRLFFRQSKPYPVTISAIVPEVDIAGKKGG